MGASFDHKTSSNLNTRLQIPNISFSYQLTLFKTHTFFNMRNPATALSSCSSSRDLSPARAHLDHRPLLSISSKEHCLPSLKGSFGILFAPHISPLCTHCVYLRLSDCLFIKSGKLMASKRSHRVSGREIRRRLLSKENCTSTHRLYNMRGTTQYEGHLLEEHCKRVAGTLAGAVALPHLSCLTPHAPSSAPCAPIVPNCPTLSYMVPHCPILSHTVPNCPTDSAIVRFSQLKCFPTVSG